MMRVEKAEGIGFCFGVRQAIAMLEKAARERGGVETVGAVVHNQQVLQKLADEGIVIAGSVDAIKGNTVAIGAHGVDPELEAELRARYADVIDTTCPFVKRAQIAARRLARAGFLVIIYGDTNHREVKGILGWANGRGIATLDSGFVRTLARLPRRLGVLSQTTQIPAHFNQFVKDMVDAALTKDSELRVIDTICHDLRQRQQVSLELAKKVDLMFIIGGRSSANTSHLAELCSTVTETCLVETADEIQSSWLRNHDYIGVTGGASTDENTISEVLTKLAAML